MEILDRDEQLSRIERTIAELEARPPAKRVRVERLLAALYREREAVLDRPAPPPRVFWRRSAL